MSDNPFALPWDGQVTNNRDPQGMYRVKFTIPGLLDESNWALPWGTFGGGSRNRGGHLTPAVGANIGCLFVGGNQSAPRYVCGYWAMGDQPEESIGASGLLGDPDTFALSLGGVRLMLKAAGDKGYARLAMLPADKRTYLELDGTKNSATLTAIRNLFLTAVGRVFFDGITVEFFNGVNKRVVRKKPGPI